MDVKPVIFETQISLLLHLIGMRYLYISPARVQALGGKFSMRLLCTVNSQITFQCGLVSLGEGAAYISINQKRMKQLGVEVGDTVTVKLEKDESEYGVEVPEELTELFAQDDEGFERFKFLPAGKQRYILNHVSSVKDSQKRIERAVLLITNLKKCKPGKESFREMLGK